MTYNWECVVEPGVRLLEEELELRDRLGELADSQNWTGVFQILQENPTQVNKRRRGGGELLLSKAIRQGVGIEIVRKLIDFGASRMLCWPYSSLEVGPQSKASHLQDIVQPILPAGFTVGWIEQVQDQLEMVMNSNLYDMEITGPLFRPKLGFMVEFRIVKLSCIVPGMYGGWIINKVPDGFTIASTSRVAEGWGRTYHITAESLRLIDRDPFFLPKVVRSK